MWNIKVVSICEMATGHGSLDTPHRTGHGSLDTPHRTGHGSLDTPHITAQPIP